MSAVRARHHGRARPDEPEVDLGFLRAVLDRMEELGIQATEACQAFGVDAVRFPFVPVDE